MTPAKTFLALCLFGVLTSTAHAEMKCGPTDTKETQGGMPMCCYTETKAPTCGTQKTSSGEYLDCSKIKKTTTKTCVDLRTRSKELEKKK